MKRLILTIALMMSIMAVMAKDIRVVVKNMAVVSRSSETIELNANTIRQKIGGDFVITYKNKQVPFQITYDNKLIFQVSLSPKSSAVYIIKKGTPEHFADKVTGKLHQERLDDVAWENDRIAYRCYGPALQKSGEKAYGYDIWLKRTHDFVCDFRYGQEYRGKSAIKALKDAGKINEAKHYQDSISYHIDHGTGLDNYNVGATLGACTDAFLEDGKIIYPYCYTQQQVLDNGPIRFTVRLVYPVVYKGVSLTETRIVSLDAGSQLNKAVISWEGQTASLPVIAGIVLHDGSKDYTYSVSQGYVAYAEKYNKDGQTFLGMVFPYRLQAVKTIPLRDDETLARAQGADGHIVALSNIPVKGHLTYYWGAGWSKFGFKDADHWNAYIRTFAQKLHSPLRITIR